MRAALLCALLAMPAFAGLPCQPLVTLEGTRGEVDLMGCGELPTVKSEMRLEIGGVRYAGVITESYRRIVTFSLDEPVVASAQTGVLEVYERNGTRTWRVDFETRGGGGGPPQSGTNPNDDATNPNVETEDIVAFHDANDVLWAYTSSAAELQLTRAGIWQATGERSGNLVPLPVRHAGGASTVDTNGTLRAAEVETTNLPPINATAERAVWAVGDAGRIHRYDERNTRWTQSPTGATTENLYAIAFDGAEKHAAVAGANGLILTSTDAGTSWQRRTAPTSVTLRAASIADDKTIFVAGDRGIVLKSENGGTTFTHVTREDGPLPSGLPLPAPWYILINLLVTVPALVLAVRGRPSEDAITQSESIADRLVSDRALEAGEPDALNLRSIALGISRFLRNDKTVPPLTVAITGEWGSGKSSLMNLLKADLAEFGFRPVWFNAWHHQKEQHFLASLVAAIRDHAAPPLWHVPFRARLLWLRSKRHPGAVALLLLVVAILIGYETAHEDHKIADSVVGALRGGTFAEFLVELPARLKDEFAILIGIAGALGALWKGLRSFAAKPAALLATISSQANLQDLDKEISFRGRFAPEFRDVTTALGDRPLVLFIDDLDRCQPDSVREMLEAINYLMTSGSCFIILGIDRARVERYLELAFAAAAQGEPNFAANYLDKLINIEVPVPAPNDRQAMQILTPPEAAEERPAARERLGAVLAGVWRFKPVVLAVLVIAFGIGIGSMMRPKPETPAPQVTLETNTGGAFGAGRYSVVQASALAPGLTTGTSGTAIAGESRSRLVFLWPIALLLASLAAVAIWLAMRKPGLVVHDSDEFIAALEAWQPLLVARNRTPRSLKRFINRVRFLAMRQRPAEEEETMWRAFRAALSGRKGAPPRVQDVQPIPEADLVALAALSQTSRDGAEHTEAMRLSIVRHEEKFGTFDQQRWAAQFQRIASDVQAN